MSLKFGELFAGYGGLGMGVQSVLGGEMAWCAEFDKAPSKILAHHWPDVPNLGDVTKVDWASGEPVDVSTGGSPCQDLSHAGKRLGMKAGTRSGLWASMCDAIDIIRPSLVVWENVRGALSAEADSALEPCPGCVGDGDDGPVLRALGRVLGDLAELGYDAWWYGLRAADVGAAHGRFRIFVFAQPAADPFGSARRLSADLGRIQRPRPVDSAPDLTLPPTPAVNDMGASYTPETWDEWTAKMQAAHGNGNGHGKSLAIEAQRLLPTPAARDHKDHRIEVAAHRPDDTDTLNRAIAHLLPTPRATDGTKGGPNQRGSSGDLMLPSAVQSLLPTPSATRGGSATETTALLPTPRVTQAGYADDGRGGKSLDVEARSGERWGDYGPAIARWESAIGRPAPAPTEPGAKGNPRLSPAFVEWLMGLPAGHVTDPAIGISRNDQLKALGNGVVWQQCAAATRAFIADMTKAVA